MKKRAATTTRPAPAARRAARAAAVRIVIKHRGELGAFGYRDVRSLTVRERRAALDAASKQLGWLHIVRKLGALAVFNKNRHPRLAALFRSDRRYASRRHRAE